MFVQIASPEVMKITCHTVLNFLNFTSSLLMLLFVQPLSVNSLWKLPGTLKLTIIQAFDHNFIFFTECCHVDSQCGA